MTRLFSTFLFSVMGITFAFCQESFYEKMLNDKIKMAQRPKTEKMLRNFFRPATSKSDTITAIFFIPTACPRCEATFAPTIKLAHTVRPQENIVLVAVYEDGEAAKLYMEKLNTEADKQLLDTANIFDYLFSTTMGGLQGSFIARIDVKSGRMITGGELSYISPTFFKDFFAVQTPFPFFVYDEGVVEYKNTAKSYEKNQYTDDGLLYSKHELLFEDLLPSQVRNHPIERNKELIFLDEMCGGGVDMLCDSTGIYRLKCLQQIDSTKRDTFIVLSPQDYESCKDEFRYMPLDIVFQPDSGLVMSYSIPNVSIETINNESTIAFRNAPTFIHLKDSQRGWEPLVTVSNYDMKKWMLQHYRIFPIRPEHIVLTCHKYAWPIVQDIKKGDSKSDPFTDSFYEQQNNAYAMEIDLTTGKITRLFGQLENVFRQTRTGYWFTDLVADTHKGNFIYGNQVVGKLYLTNDKYPENTLRTYEVFKTKEVPRIDSTLFYKEEYLQIYTPYFNRILEQVTLDDLYINCLIRTGILGHENLKVDTYEYVRISRETGEAVMRYSLPSEISEERLLAYGLTANDKGNLPFYISKHKGRYYLKYVEKK